MGDDGTGSPDGTSASKQFKHLTNDVLESKLTQLTTDINAATCQQLLMIAEFDRRRAWGHEGMRSCAHWLIGAVVLALPLRVKRYG